MDSSLFKVHDKLNPLFWDNETKKLLPKARKGLLSITKKYLEFLDLNKDVKIKDVVFTGSLANYNYNDNSDVDIHIILDYSQISNDNKFVMNYFLDKKDIWSEKYDITAYGYPVELFAQDDEQPREWTSVYSLINDEWIQQPKLDDSKIDKETITNKVHDFVGRIRKIEKESSQDDANIEDIEKRLNELKKELREYRQKGLQSGGELSTENLVYKILRNGNYLELLNDIKKKLYDKELTIKERLKIDC